MPTIVPVAPVWSENSGRYPNLSDPTVLVDMGMSAPVRNNRSFSPGRVLPAGMESVERTFGTASDPGRIYMQGATGPSATVL